MAWWPNSTCWLFTTVTTALATRCVPWEPPLGSGVPGVEAAQAARSGLAGYHRCSCRHPVLALTGGRDSGPGPHGQCYSGSSCSHRGSRPGLCRQRACISRWKGPVRLHLAAASCRPSSHVGWHPAVCWPPGGGDGCGAAGSGQGHDRWPGLGTSLQVASKLRPELRPTGLRMQGISQGPCGRALDPHLRVTPMDREEPCLGYPDGQGDVAEVGPWGAWCSSCMWWHRSASQFLVLLSQPPPSERLHVRQQQLY